MIRDLRSTVLRSTHAQFVEPRYDGYCFANLPNTILELLGVPRIREGLDGSVTRPLRDRPLDHVLLFLIDGLGFDTWLAQASKLPFFKRLGERGTVTSLTAVFPSTTSASLTALATGLPPSEHGLPEWMVYLEEIDDVIATLPFKRWNGKARDDLLASGVDPSILFDGGTIFERLTEAGVLSVCFSQRDYAQSAYSKVSKRGSRTVSFLGLSDLMVRLADELEKAAHPTFFYVYWDHFDRIEHAFSPGSREALAELLSISHAFTDVLNASLRERSREVAGQTLLLVTADHGQTPVAPDRTIYLTDRPEIREALKAKRSGEPIPPTGSIRDVLLHLQPNRVQAVEQYLTEWLAGRAEVVRTEDAFARGLFGPGPPVARLRRRVGQLLVLPYTGETVWGYYPGQARPHSMRGHHGGLTPEEMFIPFASCRLSELLAE